MLEGSLRRLLIDLVGKEQMLVSEIKIKLIVDLWNILKGRGLAIQDIAKKLGVSEDCVLETFEGDSIESILKVAYTFGCKVTLEVKEKYV